MDVMDWKKVFNELDCVTGYFFAKEVLRSYSKQVVSSSRKTNDGAKKVQEHTGPVSIGKKQKL